ncbi:T9SS type A sorting domain-containing protein [Crocinitomix algicola]|uniref:T9SS type A sorting domain-containing protein n=1 Tax=Crocinitomix algicola TaxID=1740263 RepID=UPI000872AD2C|nr:T9SS type A sorting domain-containing protein [Crocinitomix algicola]
MKKIYIGLAALLTGLTGISQVVYSEDFNDSDGGWTEESGLDWAWGAPVGATINYDGDACGENAWVTNLSGDYSNSANAIIESPTIDCSGLLDDPYVEFSLNYITESCCDEGWMEFSLDDGDTWVKLTDGGEAIGWYNDMSNQWWDGEGDGWSFVSNRIPGAAGVATVKLRFVFTSDGSVTREGFGFDNIVVASEIASVSMIGVTNIESGLPLTDSENIEIQLTNNTANDILDLSVCYVLDGGAAVCETIGVVTPGLNTYTFTATEDFSETGEYEIVAYTDALETDYYHCDDTSVTNAVLILPISEFPFVEDFEGATAFTGSGTWEIGAPLEGNPFFNNLACEGATVLGTTIAGNYPNSAFDFAYSPYFDFSGLAEDPYVLMDIYRETESCCDESYIEYTLDDGVSWSRFGASGSGLNWYNDGSNQWWDGTNDGWEYAYHQATGLAGESSVRFRFVFSSDGSVTRPGIAIDNFTIQTEEPIVVDGVPTGVTMSNDFTVCGFTTSDYLIGEFEILGVDTLFGYTVCYDLGDGLVCEEFPEDTLLPGTYFHTFEGPIDLSGELSYDVLLSITSDSDYRDCGGKVFTMTTEILGMSSEATITDITCNGEADGQIFVNPVNGEGGYEVNWESGDVGFLLNDLTAGYHVYTITDANGCTFTDSAEVVEPDALVLDVEISHDYEGGVGAIDLTVTGGTEPYTFDWDNDGTGDYDAEDIEGLEPGTYTVVVTDANGCTEEIMVNVLNTASIEETTFAGLNVYPNPTNGAFQIALQDVSNSTFNVTIFNILGEVVLAQELVNATTSIEAGVLESGVYLVEIATEGQTKTVRLVVQ